MSRRFTAIFAAVVVAITATATARTSSAGFTYDLAKACVAKGGQVKAKAYGKKNLPLPDGRVCDFTAVAQACPSGTAFEMESLSCQRSDEELCGWEGGQYYGKVSAAAAQRMLRMRGGGYCDLSELEQACGEWGGAYIQPQLGEYGAFQPSQCTVSKPNPPLRAACEAQGGVWADGIVLVQYPDRFVANYPSGSCDLTAPAKRCNQEPTLKFVKAGTPTGYGCLSQEQGVLRLPGGGFNPPGTGSSCALIPGACGDEI